MINELVECKLHGVGVLDILLFVRIPEPTPVLSQAPALARFLAPFKEKRFLRLILFTCVLNFGTMMAAPFFVLYLLEEIGLPVHLVVLLFMSHALGGVLFARRVGRLADEVGNRPVIILSSAFKSAIVIAMFLVRPGHSVWVLVPVLLFDNMINTALMSSRTGFMLKQSPAANRGMFIAAVLAPAGLVGALSSLIGGTLIHRLPDLDTMVMGVPLTSFRMVFLVSAVLRFTAFVCSHAIHEPESDAAGVVLARLLAGVQTRFTALVTVRR